MDSTAYCLIRNQSGTREFSCHEPFEARDGLEFGISSSELRWELRWKKRGYVRASLANRKLTGSRGRMSPAKSASIYECVRSRRYKVSAECHLMKTALRVNHPNGVLLLS